MFQVILQKHLRKPIKYIGEEKSYGKHLERYLFYHGGFMELILEPPLVLKAHFLDKHRAQRFERALKKTFDEIIPDSQLKEIFLEGIAIEEAEEDPIPMQKWAKMHHIYLEKSLVFTIVAVVIVGLFAAIKASVEIISLNFLQAHSVTVTVISAVIIAFLFEPIKKKTEKLVDRFWIK